MAREISIAISARDNYSPAITNMRNASMAFNKELEAMQGRLEKLGKTKIELSLETMEIKRSMKSLTVAFQEVHKSSEGAITKETVREIRQLTQEYEHLEQKARILGKVSAGVDQQLMEISGTLKKEENRLGGWISPLNAPSKNALLKMGGDVAAQMASTMVSSAFGSEVGGIFSSALSSAASGAALGMMSGIAGGALVGGVAGGAVGVASGMLQNYQKEDEAFKSFVQETYGEVQQSHSDSLDNGVGIAAQRQLDQISFSTLLGGKDVARQTLEEIKAMANSTPYLYDNLAGIAKNLAVLGYNSDEIMSQLQGIGGAGAAIGWGTPDMEAVAQQIGFMKESEKVSTEQLKQLLRKGIKVYDYLGEGLGGLTQSEISERVSEGRISGEAAAEIISAGMLDEYGAATQEQSETYFGLSSTVKGLTDELDNARGEGYIDKRTRGYETQIEWMNGESGERMKEAYRMMGEHKAYLENLSDELERDAMDAVFKGVVSDKFTNEETRERLEELAGQYQDALGMYEEGSEEAGNAMGSIFSEAKAIAMMAYNATEGAQLALQSDIDLAQSIANDAAVQEEYYNAGHKMGIQFSKGLAATRIDRMKELAARTLEEFETGSISREEFYAGNPHAGPQAYDLYLQDHAEPSMKKASQYAFGIPYVPYNNFPAMLHEGERVLTAAEARGHPAGAGNLTVNVAELVVREEADVDRVARAIFGKMRRAALLGAS